jgi:enoyl-CoA hydratase
MIPPMRFDTIAISRHGPVAEVRLSRPARRNPIDPQFLEDLETAAAALHDDDSVTVVLLSAEGDVFSAGQEVDETAPPPSHDRLPFRCLELMAQPVVALIEGDAIGAGLELTLACDVRIAADHVMFAMPDLCMGMMPCGGGTQRLPRLVGRAMAAEIVLLAEPLGAARALAFGLVNHIAPAAEVRALAEQLAQKIAARGPLAVRYAKEAINRGLDMPLDQALRYETDLTVILQTTHDRAEGVRAFLERRPARFEGR